MLGVIINSLFNANDMLKGTEGAQKASHSGVYGDYYNGHGKEYRARALMNIGSPTSNTASRYKMLTGTLHGLFGQKGV